MPNRFTVILADEMIALALRYFFLKATSEIQHFLPKRKYIRISELKDGILYFSGRILPTQQFDENLHTDRF